MRFAAISSALVLACCATLFAAAPEIRHFAPHALRPGETVTLTFTGSGLENASHLWTSFGGTARPVPASQTGAVSFEVVCPPEASGIGALQLSGPAGVSNFQLVAVDSLPSHPHKDKHQMMATAQELPVPGAIDSILKPDSRDYYRLNGKAGQTISIEILAHRLGADLDSAVQILDVSGRELAFCDDGPGVSRDSALQFTFPKTGSYFLAVHDIGFAGGANYDYRLRIGDFPVSQIPYPTPPVVPDVTQVLENEPNQSKQEARQFGIPSIIQGKIDSATDLDLFRFLVLKDQKLVFQSFTRSLGSPCDLILRVLKENGDMIAVSDPAGPFEAAITNSFKEAGIYTLEVREPSGSAGDSLPYQIHVRSFASGYQLESEESKLEVVPGGETTLKITCKRFEFPGAIQLKMVPPAEGITLENNQIPENKNETELKIRASEGWTPGTVHRFQIAASAAGAAPQKVSTRPALRKAFPLMLQAPAVLDGLFALGVKEKQP